MQIFGLILVPLLASHFLQVILDREEIRVSPAHPSRSLRRSVLRPTPNEAAARLRLPA